MYVDFNSLPGYARVWIYQANRKFSTAEEKAVGEAARLFCEQWEAHAAPLKTSFLIDHHQFLVLAVDQGFNQASGCSIDGSVRMLKALQDQTGLDFFDRTKVAFYVDGEVKLVALARLKDSLAGGTLDAATMTFNVLASDKETFEKDWLVAAGKTWVGRHLPKTPAV